MINEFFETTNQYVERKIRECKEEYREYLGREPTELEIESWLIND